MGNEEKLMHTETDMRKRVHNALVSNIMHYIIPTAWYCWMLLISRKGKQKIGGGGEKIRMKDKQM